MAQPNWWEDAPVVGPAEPPAAPAFPGVIQGRPKTAPPPTPIQIEDQAMERERLRLAQEAADRAAQSDAQGTESERTAGFLTGRIVDAVQRLGKAVKANPTAAAPTLGVETVRGVFGDTAANYLTDAERQQVRAAQMDIIDAGLTLGTGAAYTREQLEGYRETYFPKLGDDPATVTSKQAALRSLLVNARTKAGKAAPDLDAALAAIDALSVPTPATTANPVLSSKLDAMVRAGAPYEEVAALVAAENGTPIDPDKYAETVAYARDNPDFAGSFAAAFTKGATPAGTPPGGGRAAELSAMEDAGIGTLAAHGMSLGLTDEAAGVGGAVASLLTGDFNNVGQAYRDNRDARRMTIERARTANPIMGTVAEFAGGMALPAKALAGMPGLRDVVRTGVRTGALGGFGYGEGLEGSVINTVGGGALGGVIGFAGHKAGGALANYATRRMGASDELATRALELDRAGQAEGVLVNRAMVDPALANRVSGVDASLVGGPKLQRGMRAIEDRIETRVSELGANGRAMDELAGGDTVKGAGERFIEKSGKSAKRKYDRAEQLAGDAKVEPQESLARVNQMIATLGETPGTNSAEIAFLETIKGDLGKDLSVGALRRMRTSLRKKISKGELVFGEDEARVLAIMEGAADDIRAGLTAQGKPEAARAFDTADKAYRARMEYITDTVQKLIGKRNATAPAEDAWKRFQSMAKPSGDARGLRKFYASLTPEERTDVAASFADDLGRNNAGDFSVAHLLSQSEKLSDSAIRTIFGPEGAQSLQNLRVLGREAKRVTGAMNSRTSKTAVAGDYRSWLANLLLGGGGGFLAGGASTGTALAGAAAVGGVKAARDILSANALMSPKLTQWLRQTPRTSDPAQIDAHFRRLGAIAKAEPALAGDIDILREAVMRAANDNVGVSAVASDTKEDQKQ